MPYYTLFSLVSVLAVSIMDIGFHTYLYNSVRFWLFMVIIMILTLIFDNYAVYKGIYEFNTSMIVNIRLPYSPIENSFFSFSFITAQIIVYEWYTRKKYSS